MRRGRKPKCPYCGSDSTVRKGHRVTVTLGKRPLAWCKSCERKFTIGGTRTAAEAAKSTMPAAATPVRMG